MGEDPMSNLADRDGYMEDFGKIDLHLHLDGSLPAETILKLAGKCMDGLTVRRNNFISRRSTTGR